MAIHALSIKRVAPFYNSSSTSSTETSPFSYNQTTRKSFTRGNQKLRLSINSATKPTSVEEVEEQSSPNLSIELVDEDIDDPLSNQIQFENIANNKKSTFNTAFQSLSSISSSSGPSSLNFPNRMALGDEFMLNESNPPIISNYEDTEIEDFPVNNAQPPDYASSKKVNQKNLSIKQKTTATIKRPQSTLAKPVNRLSKMNSISTVDLSELDDQSRSNTKKFGNGSVKPRRDVHPNKENVKNKNQNATNKASTLTRAKTSVDLKTNQIRVHHQQQQQTNRPVQRQGLQREIKTTNQTASTIINANTNLNYNGMVDSNLFSTNNTMIHMPRTLPEDLLTTLVRD